MGINRVTRGFKVLVNGIEVARYFGNPGSTFQVATNHAFDLFNEYQDRAANGEPEYLDYEVTVNGRNIKEYIY